AVADMDGKSYRSNLEGKTPANWRTSMYYRYYMHLDESHHVSANYGVRTPRYTLIYYPGKAPPGTKGASKTEMAPQWDLFDRQQDPTQMRNVYNNPNYADAVRDLKKELERLRAEVKDDQ